MRTFTLLLATVLVFGARHTHADQHDASEAQKEFCIQETSKLHAEPCATSSAEKGELPVGTKLVYDSPPDIKLGCDLKNWLPVYDSGVAYYVANYGNCSNLDALLEEAGYSTKQSGAPLDLSLTWFICIAIAGVTLLIVVPVCAVAVVMRRRMNKRSAPTEMRSVASGGGGGGGGKRRKNSMHRSESQTRIRAGSNAGAAHYPAPAAQANQYTNSSVNTQSHSSGQYPYGAGNGGTTPEMIRPGIVQSATDPTRQYATFMPNQGANNPDAIYWGTDALIPYSDIRLEEEVGRGGFGKVYRGVYRGETVAVKSMAEGLRDKDIADFRQEAKLLARMTKHPNVVTFIGLSSKNDQILMVMEFLPDGSLLKHIESDASYGREEILGWLRDVARGMLHLVQHNLIHRDLAARNILLADGKRTAKVTDFGMSREQKSENTAHVTKCNVGPLKWMSPESLLDKQWSEKTDVWAFGVLMFEVLAREEPYADLEPVQVASQVCRDTICLEPPPHHGSDLLDLIKQCMQYEPQDRYNFEQVLLTLNEMY